MSEFVADNSDLEDEDLDTPDWIELTNCLNVPVSLNGYYLTNDPLNKTLWALPAITMQPFGYTLVFASGKDRPHTETPPHTNFKLPKEGGYLALVAPDGNTLISEFTYAAQAKDVAFGERGIDRTLGDLETPTPGSANAGRQAAATPAEGVAFSRPGGLTVEPVSLSITAPLSPTAVVRYTLDNSVPTEASPAYSVPFNISSTTIVRARVFDTDRLPGPTSSRTFLQLAADVADFTSALPIVIADSNGFDIDAENSPTEPRPFRPVYSVTIDTDPSDGFARMTGTIDYNGRGGMHVRGNSSSGFPKRQYAWELWNNEDEDSSSSILGMPSESDWILHAPYSDKTLMRNRLVFTKARELYGNGGGVRSHYVEVFFNQGGGPITMDDYQGIYLVMENIKRDSDRVNIEKLNEFMTEPSAITGGYVFKKDKPPYSRPWNTATEGIALDLHLPDSANETQFAWLTNHVNAFESALHAPSFDDPDSGYASFIDVESFIDSHLFVEIFKDVDGFRLSQYFTKSRAGKIRALPVWDFNLSLGNADYLDAENPIGWRHTTMPPQNYYWYPRLFEDVEFDLAYWDRFWELRRGSFADSELFSAIDGFDTQLDAPDASGQSAVTRNFDRWPVLGTYVWPNAAGFATRTTHQSEIDWMKDWLEERMAWAETQSRGTSGSAQPPEFSSYGGNVGSGFELAMTDANSWAGGSIYYTIDGSDPRVPGTEEEALTTLVSENANCDVFVPTATNGGDSLTIAQWAGAAAPPNSANWVSGMQGIGFETAGGPLEPEINFNVESIMRDINSSCYLRFQFNFGTQEEIDALSTLTLRVKYDDSFAAFINGTFVTNDPSRTPDPLVWNSGAIGFRNDSLSVQWVDFDLSNHIGVLQPGENTLGIQMLNLGKGGNDALCRVELVGSSGGGNRPSPNARIYQEALALNDSTELRARVFDGTQWSPLTSANFIIDTIPASASNLVVSELDYRPAAPIQEEIDAGFASRGDFEFIELMNIHPTAHIDLTDVSFSNGIVFTFTETISAASRDLAPGARLVLVANPSAFSMRHPSTSVAGTFTGALSNGGETIEILDSSLNIIRSFTYDDAEPWPVAADGDGFTLTLVAPETAPIHSDPTSWRSSVSIGGSPGDTDAEVFVGDPNTDEDNDGQNAFLEFVLGSSDSDAGALSTPVIEIDIESHLIFEFQYNLAAEGVTITIERSSALTTWSDASADFTKLSTSNNGDGTATARFRSNAPYSGLSDHSFLRLRVRARIQI